MSLGDAEAARARRDEGVSSIGIGPNLWFGFKGRTNEKVGYTEYNGSNPIRPPFVQA